MSALWQNSILSAKNQYFSIIFFPAEHFFLIFIWDTRFSMAHNLWTSHFQQLQPRLKIAAFTFLQNLYFLEIKSAIYQIKSRVPPVCGASSNAYLMQIGNSQLLSLIWFSTFTIPSEIIILQNFISSSISSIHSYMAGCRIWCWVSANVSLLKMLSASFNNCKLCVAKMYFPHNFFKSNPIFPAQSELSSPFNSEKNEIVMSYVGKLSEHKIIFA